MAKPKATPRKTPKQITRLSDLKTQRKNINKGKPHGLAALDSSIRRNGYGAPMVAAADGEVFAGSKRLERSADIFGLDVKPIVVESDGTRPIVHIRTDIKTADDPRAQEMGYEDNVITVMGWNPDGELLAQLAKENEIVAALAKQENESLKALRESGNGDGNADAEPQIDKADDLNKKWKVKRGDLFVVGSHRLLCGDSTKREDMERVMEGEKARMVFTDPPYNVDYAGGASVNDSRVRAGKIPERSRIENDSLSDEDWTKFFKAWVGCAFSVLDGGIYICMSGKEWATVRNMFLESGGHWSSDIIWVKDRLVLGRKDYQSRYEAMLYGWIEGNGHYWVGVRDETDVWEINRQSVNELHPTMKLVELVERAVRNSSEDGNIVLDPFCGSGTTLVACQNLGRVCRAIEISPAYCAVILQRMTDAFPNLDIHRA